jgi:RHS repeat-associated protein
VPSPRFAVPVFALVLALLGGVLAPPAQAQAGAPADATRYVYDESGRLKAMTARDAAADPQAPLETAVFRWDAVGNLLSIGRRQADAVAVLAVKPGRGAAGDAIIIEGTAFANTTGANTVTIGGAAATVVSASTRRLEITVPTNAVTGPLTVVTADGTAHADEDFVVEQPRTPRIDTITPNRAAAETELTIDGANFHPRGSGNRVKINRTLAEVVSATPDTLRVRVPGETGAGAVTVATADGSKIGGDVFIPPFGYTLGDLDDAARVFGGDPRALSVPAANHYAMAVISGKAGERLFTQIDNGTIGSAYVQLHGPDGRQIAGTITGTTNGFLDTVTLPRDGDYTLVVDPYGSYTGSARVTIHRVPDVPASLVLSRQGASVAVTTTVPGESRRIRVAATAGQSAFVKLTNSTIQWGTLRWIRPDGSVMASQDIPRTPSGVFETTKFTADGTYTFEVDPRDALTGSATVTMYDATETTSEVATPTAVGTVGELAIAAPGQSHRLTFAGRAGQRLAAKVEASTIGSYELRLLKPDGQWAASVTSGGASGFLDRTVLPVDGTYTLVVDPATDSTGTARIRLFDVPADAGATVEPTRAGVAVPMTIGTPGQNGRVVVNGTPGKLVSVKLTASTIDFGYMRWRRPSGSVFGGGNSFNRNAFFLDRVRFDATGEHVFEIDPYEARTGVITATLYDAADTTSSIGAATATGVATDIAIDAPGQNHLLSFTGRAGQKLGIKSEGTAAPGMDNTLYRPDGTAVPHSVDAGFYVATLPVDGTYTFLVNPVGDRTGNVRLTLYDTPPDPTETVAATREGAVVQLPLPAPGQVGRVKVTVNAGDRVAARLTGSTIASGRMRWLTPAGSYYDGDKYFWTGDAYYDTIVFNTSGTYTLLVDPDGTNTGSATARIYDANDATASLTPSAAGDSADLSLPAVGQRGRVTFAGTAGQQVDLQFSNSTITSGWFTSWRPDGGYIMGKSFGTTAVTTPLSLTATGTYTALLDPDHLATGAIRVTAKLGPQTLSARSRHRLEVKPSANGFLIPLDGSTAPPKRTRRPAAYRGIRTLRRLGAPQRRSRGRSRTVNPRFRTLRHYLRPRPRAIRHTARAAASKPAASQRETSRVRALRREKRGPVAWLPTRRDRGTDWVSERPRSGWTQLPALRAKRGVTALAGQAMRLNGAPLAGVKVAIEGSSARARTDDTGRFLLRQVPAGRHVLVVDGGSVRDRRHDYGAYEIRVHTRRGRTTRMRHTIWMSALDHSGDLRVPKRTRSAMVLKNPRIPGFEIRIPAGSTIRGRDGKPVRTLNLTGVPTDRAPYRLPTGVTVSAYFTAQPGGAYLSKGAQVVYPNYHRLPAGQRVDFWNYDPDDRGWYVYGKGEVTEDGKQIVPDQGVRIWELSAAMADTSTGMPRTGPDPGGTAEDGDPVDLYTGLFVLRQTDMSVDDTLPAVLTRTYRQNDDNTYAFGRGMTTPWDIRMCNSRCSGVVDGDVRIVLPDGGAIRYVAVPGDTTGLLKTGKAAGVFNGSTMRHNSATQLYELKMRDGAVYEFAPGLPLVAMRDRFGNRMTISRRFQSGPPLQVTTPNGRWIKFDLDGSNRIIAARDNAGRRTSYTYNDAGYLATTTDLNGGTWRYGYDSFNRMTTVTDAKGQPFVTNRYTGNSSPETADGRVYEQDVAGLGTYEFHYHARCREFWDGADGSGFCESGVRYTGTSVKRPDGRIRYVRFDSGNNNPGLPVEVIDNVPSTYEPQWAPTGSRRVKVDRHYISGRVEQMTGPDGRITTFEYDDAENVTKVTRNPGTEVAAETTYTWQPGTNLPLTATDPEGRVTRWSYDAEGQLLSAVDATGAELRYEYGDERGVPLAVRDAAGNTTRYRYSDGEVVSVTDPLGRTARQFADAVGRVTQTVGADGSRTTIDVDDAGLVRRVIDAAGARTEYDYDPNGNLTAVKDPRGNTLTAEYDALDRVTAWSDQAGRAHDVAYNSSGAIARETARDGRITVYRYDALGRPSFVGVTAPGAANEDVFAATTTYQHDAADRLIAIGDSTGGTVSYEYDRFDRITSEVTGAGTVEYTYDKTGRRLTAQPEGQPLIAYAYDGAGRLKSVTQGATTATLEYDVSGHPIVVSLPNGVTQRDTYDAASQMVSRTVERDGTQLGSLRYEYDLMGRRSAAWGALAGARLPLAFGPAEYDRANRLTSLAGATFGYDATGNLISDGETTYSWNHNGELASLDNEDVSATFAYDALGRRASRSVNGAITRYQYDGWNVAAERDESGAETASTLSGLGLDTAFERRTEGTSKTLITDGLGSTIGMVAATGPLTTTAYGPFGEGEGIAGTPFQYTGRENDGTGLLNYRNRYYSPALKRFVAEDPVGAFGSGNNLYAYVDGDPINATDPLGLWPSLQEAAEFAAGFGDTVSFGLTDQFRDATGLNAGLDKSSGAYGLGGKAGMAHSFAMGGAGAVRASGSFRSSQWFRSQNKTPLHHPGVAGGKDFWERSHWIFPRRSSAPDWLKNSALNIKWMRGSEHAMADPARYRFVKKWWKAQNPLPHPLVQFWNRTPGYVQGAPAIGYAGAVLSE